MLFFCKEPTRKEGVPEGNLDAAAAHLVGQAHMESGLNPKATHDYVGGVPTGAGIYGARLKRKDAMLDWLDKNKFSKDSLEGQTRYMAHEAITKYPTTANILRNAKPENFERDTPLITKNFEAPAVINYRTGAVQQAYNSRLQQQQQQIAKEAASLIKAPSLAGQEPEKPKAADEGVAGVVPSAGRPLENQKNRPFHYGGQLKVGEHVFPYGTGGAGRGSAPYGTFPIRGIHQYGYKPGESFELGDRILEYNRSKISRSTKKWNINPFKFWKRYRTYFHARLHCSSKWKNQRTYCRYIRENKERRSTILNNQQRWKRINYTL